jgi:hypothetical protein
LADELRAVPVVTVAWTVTAALGALAAVHPERTETTV